MTREQLRKRSEEIINRLFLSPWTDDKTCGDVRNEGISLLESFGREMFNAALDIMYDEFKLYKHGWEKEDLDRLRLKDSEEEVEK